MSNSKGLDILLYKSRSWIIDCLVFAVVVVTCLPIIYATRSTGYYDDTLLFVTHALQSPPSVLGAISAAFSPNSQPGVPSTEFGVPSLALVLWTMNKLQLLGNMSLNVLAAFLVALFAVLVRRILHHSGFSYMVSVPVALLISLNPTNSEFTYFFIATQHLWTIILILALILSSLKLLSLNTDHQQPKMLIISLASTLLSGVAAISAREFFIIFALFGIAFLIIKRPTPNYPLVVIAWLTAVPFQMAQLLTGGSGWRVSSIGIVKGVHEFIPNIWLEVIREYDLPIWILSVLSGVCAQILTRKLFLPKQVPISKAVSTKVSLHATRWYAFTIGLILASSNAVRTLIVGSIPGSSHLLNTRLDDQFSRWLVIEPKLFVIVFPLLGVFTYLMLKINVPDEQLFILTILGCIVAYLSSLRELENSAALARYVIYLVPLTLLIGARWMRNALQDLRRSRLIVCSFWLVLATQIPQFVMTAQRSVATRSGAVQLVASGCKYQEPDLDSVSALEVLRLRANSLSNDRWMAEEVARDVKRLSLSPRLRLVCDYSQAASTGNWAEIADFIGSYVNGPEQDKLDSVSRLIESGSLPLSRFDDVIREQERLFFGLQRP